MVSGLSQNEGGFKALELFEEMRQGTTKPECFSSVCSWRAATWDCLISLALFQESSIMLSGTQGRRIVERHFTK